MNDVAVIAPVRKSVRVKAPIAHAFEVFTSGLTRWWPFDHGVGKKPIQKVLMEPRLGGRWLEIAEDGTETSVATITLDAFQVCGQSHPGVTEMLFNKPGEQA
jgi:hypothetical protein